MPAFAYNDPPPYDADEIVRDMEIPSDQLLRLNQVPGWFDGGGVRAREAFDYPFIDRAATSRANAQRNYNVAPIDDTPEEFEDSQAPSASRARGRSSAASPPARGRYMSNQRELMMEDEEDEEAETNEEEEEEREREAEREKREADFLVKPAKGVKPLVLKSSDADEMASRRRTKKPVMLDDDDDNEQEEVLGTQVENQARVAKSPPAPATAPATRAASPERATSPKRKMPAEEGGDLATPKRQSIVGRAFSAVVGMLSPLRSTEPSSPLGVDAAALASPGLPNSVLVSPGSMRNIVGSVARSVLDEGETRADKVEWGAADAYAANNRRLSAKRVLDLGDE